MNPSYFRLPPEKQKNLINAGYKVFASHSYKTGSISVITGEADISKSLLFYYFKNKKEYYLFLFDTAIDSLFERKAENTDGKKYDLFKLVEKSVEYRLKIMRDYPCLLQFATRAYYETSEEIQPEIEARKKEFAQIGKCEVLKIVDCNRLKNPSDAAELFNIILSIAEGCMRGQEDLSAAKIQKIIPEFNSMMVSLKRHYYKEEFY